MMMTFEEYNNDQSRQKETDNNTNSTRDTADILMDYEQLAESKGTPGTGKHIGPHIGLIGGQNKDDERGLDISQYAGPQSKTSNKINDPEAPYGTGPGNGLSQTQSEKKS